MLIRLGFYPSVLDKKESIRTVGKGGSGEAAPLSLSGVWCSSSSPTCSSDASVSLVRLSSSVPSMLLALNLSTNPSRPSSSSHSDTSSSDQSLTSSFDRPPEALPERVSQSKMVSPRQLLKNGHIFSMQGEPGVRLTAYWSWGCGCYSDINKCLKD